MFVNFTLAALFAALAASGALASPIDSRAMKLASSSFGQSCSTVNGVTKCQGDTEPQVNVWSSSDAKREVKGFSSSFGQSCTTINGQTNCEGDTAPQVKAWSSPKREMKFSSSSVGQACTYVNGQMKCKTQQPQTITASSPSKRCVGEADFLGCMKRYLLD